VMLVKLEPFFFRPPTGTSPNPLSRARADLVNQKKRRRAR
jgi:hypothetical protein